MRRPGVRAEVERIEREEAVLLDALLKARQAAGLTQAQLAIRMGTQAPVAARLERALATGRHSPSIATLRKYVKACGKSLVLCASRSKACGWYLGRSALAECSSRASHRGWMTASIHTAPGVESVPLRNPKLSAGDPPRRMECDSDPDLRDLRTTSCVNATLTPI